MKKQTIVIMITLLFFAVLYAVGMHFYKASKQQKLGFMAQRNAGFFVREHSQTKGSDDADVMLVEFLDPECETCRDFYPFVKSLQSTYPGKIKLVIRYAPFHGNAQYSIRILEAARLQGKYWETLELLYKYQPEWGSHHNPRPELIWKYLTEIDVNIEQIKMNMNSEKITGIIEQDMRDSRTLGVRKTPQFFINGKPLMEFGYEQLETAIVNDFNN